MAVISILAIVVFDTVLCLVEVPQMLQCDQKKELVTFSLILLLGTVLVILQSLNVNIPNPSDFLKWVYSPLEGFTKALLK